MDGRAIQRRESSLGTMFDVRVIFPSDPLSTDSKATEQAVSGPLMLFKVGALSHLAVSSQGETGSGVLLY